MSKGDIHDIPGVITVVGISTDGWKMYPGEFQSGELDGTKIVCVEIPPCTAREECIGLVMSYPAAQRLIDRLEGFMENDHEPSGDDE